MRRFSWAAAILALLTVCPVPAQLNISQSAANNQTVIGTAVSTGNGVSGAGVPRVAIASDNTAFTVNAAQSGTWTMQPGNTANTTAWLTQRPASSASVITTATTTAVKATSGTLRRIVVGTQV